jgi:hypothetical protein
MAKTVFGMPGLGKKPAGTKSPHDSSKAKPADGSETPRKERAPSKGTPSHPHMVKPVAPQGAPAGPIRKTDADDKAQTVLGFPAMKPGEVPMARPSSAPASPSAPSASPAVAPGKTPPLGFTSQAPAARNAHPSALSGAGVAGHGSDEMAFKETVLGMSAVSREQAEHHVAEKAVENTAEPGAMNMPVAFEETVQAGAESPVAADNPALTESPVTADSPITEDSSVTADHGGEVDHGGDVRPKGVSKTLLIIILVAVGITVAAVLINMFVVGRAVSSIPTPSVPTRLLQPPQPSQQPGIPTVQPAVPPPVPVAPTPGAIPAPPGAAPATPGAIPPGVPGAAQPAAPAPQ